VDAYLTPQFCSHGNISGGQGKPVSGVFRVRSAGKGCGLWTYAALRKILKRGPNWQKKDVWQLIVCCRQVMNPMFGIVSMPMGRVLKTLSASLGNWI